MTARPTPDLTTDDGGDTGASQTGARRRRHSMLGAVVGVVALIGAGCGSDASDADTSAVDAPASTSTAASTETSAHPADHTTAATTVTASTLVDLSEVEWVDRTGESEVEIQSRDNTFLPGYVIVKVGTPITFRNVGRTEHNALPVDEISFEGIEAAEFEPQAEHTITFDEPGDYPYYCSLHGTTTRGMVGAIRVVS